MFKEYYLDDYLNSKTIIKTAVKNPEVTPILYNNTSGFEALCDRVRVYFNDETEAQSTAESASTLKHQKLAILGVPSEVQYYKDKISEFLRNNNLTNSWYPQWYSSLVDGIFNENWGLAGIAPWVDNYDGRYTHSTSAKIIGDKIFFLINGKMELQPQRISPGRLSLLRKSLISNESHMKISDPYNDVFLYDGTRVTIFGESYTKEGRGSIIFRKFVMKDLSLNKQVELKTIPDYSKEFFRLAVELGYNTIIVGGPNSGKSTFYETLQRYEDPKLQGIQIETDPEVDMLKLMPDAPIMELIADGDSLKQIVKPILRADPDYLKVGEARDGISLHIAVKVTNKGTRRVKLTYHTSNCIDICYQMAEEIVEEMGGSIKHTAVKVARSFSYVYEFFYLNSNKNHKLLKAIYELYYNELTGEIEVRLICKYNIVKKIWEWAYHFDDNNLELGYLESIDKTHTYRDLIKSFSEKYPYSGQTVFKPRYFD